MNPKTVSWIKIMEYTFLLHQIKKKVIKQRRAQGKDTLMLVLRTQTKYRRHKSTIDLQEKVYF